MTHELCETCDYKVKEGLDLPYRCLPCTYRKHVTPRRRLYILMYSGAHVAGASGFKGLRDFVYAVLVARIAEGKIKIKK